MYEYNYANEIETGLSLRVDSLLKLVANFASNSIEVFTSANSVVENAIYGYVDKVIKLDRTNISYFEILRNEIVEEKLRTIGINLDFLHHLRIQRNKIHTTEQVLTLENNNVLSEVFSVLVSIYKAITEDKCVNPPTEKEVTELIKKNKNISVEALNSLKNEISILKEKNKREIEQAAENARLNLNNAVKQKYPSTKDIKFYANAVIQFDPDDFLANFYLMSTNLNPLEINEFLNNYDISKNEKYVETILSYLIEKCDLRKSNIIPIRNFIENVLDGDKKREFNNKIECRALNIDEGIYEINYPRDVFVAYSSKDFEKVYEIVNFLESNGVSCFVALRNLPTTIGSIENYQTNIESAIRSCKCFLFISSENSRDRECNTISKEIPYLRDHPNIARIEFEVEKYGSGTSLVSRKIIESAFENLQRCISKNDLLNRLSKILSTRHIYCPNCGCEAAIGNKYCPNCGYDLNEHNPHLKDDSRTVNPIDSLSSNDLDENQSSKSEGKITKDEKSSSPDEEIFNFYINKVFKDIKICNFKRAKETLDKAILIKKNDPKIYIAKLLIKNRLSSIEQIQHCVNPLDEDDNFFMAVTYADGELKSQLLFFNESIKNHKYELLKKSVDDAKNLLIDLSKIDECKKIYKSLTEQYKNFNYRDSNVLLEDLSSFIKSKEEEKKLTEEENFFSTFKNECKKTISKIDDSLKYTEFINKYKNYDYKNSIDLYNKVREARFCNEFSLLSSIENRPNIGKLYENLQKRFENFLIEFKDFELVYKSKYEKILFISKKGKSALAADEDYSEKIRKEKELILNATLEKIRKKNGGYVHLSKGEFRKIADSAYRRARKKVHMDYVKKHQK